MRIAHHKTAKFPKMKRLAMYFSIIIVLCFFNLVAINAQGPNNLTSTTNTLPANIMVVQEEEEPESELKEIDRQNMLQKRQQTLQMMSNVMKMIHDNTLAIIRKIG